MATLVKTIKSRSTGDIIYPVTKADAVYFNDNNNLVSVQGKINTIQGLLGNETLTTTAQTLAGAINEHQTDISTLNSKLTPDAIFIGTASSAISDGVCRIIVDKTTNTYRISMYARNTTQNIPIGTTIFTLPQTIAPPSENWGIPATFVLADGATHTFYVTIKPDGTIIQSYSSTTREIFACGEWKVN